VSLSQSQLDTIAKCSISGLSTRDIAAYASCSDVTVRTLLKGGHNEKFDLLYAGWQKKALSTLVDHRFKLQEHLELAYGAIGDSLRQTNDARLRVETAWKLIDRLTGHQDKAAVNLNVGLQANVTAEQVHLAFGDIGSQLGDLLGSLRTQRGNGRDPHEKLGDEALPASYKLVNEDQEGPGAKPNGGGTVEAVLPQGTPEPKGE
jgi:hypothetical protein